VNEFIDGTSEVEQRRLRYRLCPKCYRAVPTRSGERYCINDGTWMLECCPLCGAGIGSPYAHFCSTCGLKFVEVENSSRR
jgi:hypothetical protein